MWDLVEHGLEQHIDAGVTFNHGFELLEHGVKLFRILGDMVDDTVEPRLVDAMVLGKPFSSSDSLLGQDGVRLFIYPTCGLGVRLARQVHHVGLP